MQQAEFFFDDIELYELDVLSPPPPSPPPPPNVLLWLDGEGGPGSVQTVVAPETTGAMVRQAVGGVRRAVVAFCCHGLMGLTRLF